MFTVGILAWIKNFLEKYFRALKAVDDRAFGMVPFICVAACEADRIEGLSTMGSIDRHSQFGRSERGLALIHLPADCRGNCETA